MHQLVLASQSPRRSELLQRAGYDFAVAPTQISEIPDENLNLQDQIRDLARRKAEACVASGKVLKGLSNIVLSADTVVVLAGKILGKPENLEENAHFMRLLSGQTHSVITAVCLVEVDTGKTVIGHETSLIRFKVLNEKEIADFCASGEGLDKAGGYGIQGLAGKFVEQLEGPMDNVIGLPISLVEKLLKENGWDVCRR